MRPFIRSDRHFIRIIAIVSDRSDSRERERERKSRLPSRECFAFNRSLIDRTKEGQASRKYKVPPLSTEDFFSRRVIRKLRTDAAAADGVGGNTYPFILRRSSIHAGGD